MNVRKNESPTATGRHALAQGAVVESKPIEINGVILTEQVIATLHDLQVEGYGETIIDAINRLTKHILDADYDSCNTSELARVMEFLRNLRFIEEVVTELVPAESKKKGGAL